MRQIKFRIWHKGHKRFLKNGVSTHCFSQYVIDVFSGQIYDAVGEIGGDGSDFRTLDYNKFYFDGIEIIKGQPYVLQQFTGLKDKNNKEIYEGDIIYHRGSKLGPLEYKFGSWCIDDGLYELTDYWEDNTKDGDIADVEVRGHIYEQVK